MNDLSELGQGAPRPARDETIGVLLVEDLPEVAEHVRGLVDKLDHIDILETADDGDVVLDRIRDVEPDLLIIDALLQGPQTGVSVAKRLRDTGIDLPILMTTVPDRPLATGTSMGIIETLSMPLEADALRDAIIRLDETYRGPIPARLAGNHVLYSGSGGVGRTTIAYNLAIAATRSTGIRVALVDGDLQFGGLRLLLDAPAEAPSILQLPTNHVTADDLRSVMWTVDPGVDVLLAPERIEQADLVMPPDLARTLRLMNEVYDVVIVDAPTMLVDTTFALFDSADQIILVATPTNASVANAARCLRALEAAGYRKERLKVILNQVGVPGLTPEAVRAALQRDPDALVPHDPMIADSGRGTAPCAPIISLHPDAPGSRALTDLPTVLAAGMEST